MPSPEHSLIARGFADLDRVHLTTSMEHRQDRGYDAQDPATIVHPNGLLMRVGNSGTAVERDLCAAMTREALRLYRETV